MLRAVFPKAIILPKNSFLQTYINLRAVQLISEIDALVDSGATDNFISPDIIQQFDIPT